MLTSQSSVTSAQNTLNTAKASLQADQAKNQNGLDSARATVAQALNTVLAAQDTQNSDQTKNQGTVQTAQATVDSAQQALNQAQATLGSTVAAQQATIQTGQNTVAQDQAALKTQQATYNQTTAPPTQAAMDAAHAQTQNARAALQLAQNNLDAAVLTAPADGTIASLSGSVGQWISGGATSSGSTSTSSTGTTSSTNSNAFITLTNLTTQQVQAQVSEADIGKVQVGDKVTFTLTAYPGRTFTGTVATIQPNGTTASNVVTYNVMVNVDPTDVQLLPDMTATATIITEQDNNAVLVPNGALAYAQTAAGTSGTNASTDSASVYVLRNGSPVLQPIQIGSTDSTNTVVTSGLQPGDQVVTGVSTAAASKSTGASIFGFGGNNNRGASTGSAGGSARPAGSTSGAGATAGAANRAPSGQAAAGGAPAGGPPPGP
ncbi:MAG: HlyD family efflux transporter periplasmic adaptor subunit [Chloroflexi bacterium]|nr:HlyD family efflux transporter periplasmic adaptor subunit [Chloroflexota bacterium]